MSQIEADEVCFNLLLLRSKKPTPKSSGFSFGINICMAKITELTPAQLKKKPTKQRTFEELKMQWVIDAWIRNNGNQIEAALELGVERHTVARYVNKFRAISGDILLHR